MNHQKIYESIIKNAKNQKRVRLTKNDENYVYYENHHIIPRCLGGEDVEDNLVLLTAREHFICHKLLTYIYKGNRKIVCAFHLMTFMNKRKYGITSRDYAYAIELFRNIPVSEETRKKLSKIPATTKGLTYIEFYIEKFGEEIGLQKYKEFKIRNKDKNIGEKNPMYGKKQKPESIEKNKKSQPYNSANFPQWLKDKIGEKSKGENNAMAGKSFYDVWVIKFGKEMADEKLKQYKNNLKGKRWMHNLILNKSKQIKKEELEEYMKNGWEEGRLPQRKRKPVSEETKIKQSNKRKEYWKLKKQNI
jgi:hypothetical protein